MPLDGLHLPGPALLVAPIRRFEAVRRQAVEAGFDHGKERAALHFLELEDDQLGRLGGVVDGRVHRVGVPAPGEEPLRLDPLDGHLEGNVLVALVGDPPGEPGAGGEGAGELDPEPAAELPRVGQSPPDPGAGRAQQHLLLDAVGGHGIHTQPPGCKTWGQCTDSFGKTQPFDCM